jgi:hypothetical protein
MARQKKPVSKLDDAMLAFEAKSAEAEAAYCEFWDAAKGLAYAAQQARAELARIPAEIRALFPAPAAPKDGAAEAAPADTTKRRGRKPKAAAPVAAADMFTADKPADSETAPDGAERG